MVKKSIKIRCFWWFSLLATLAICRSNWRFFWLYWELAWLFLTKKNWQHCSYVALCFTERIIFHHLIVMIFLINTHSSLKCLRMDLNKKSASKKYYHRLIGDPIEAQNNHVLKSPTSGRNNKIYQKHFWLLLQHPFLPTKMSHSVNEKWFFCEKNHFLFSDQVWKMCLGHIGKNGPKTHFQLKIAFFDLIIR